MRFPKHQNGFLSILAVMIIILFGIFGSALVYLFIVKAVTTSHLVAQTKAFSLAETAREEALFLLKQPSLATREGCATLNNVQSFSTGSATAAPATDAAHTINPLMSSTNLTSLSTTLVVTDSSALAPNGRVYIDREGIDYGKNDTGTNTLFEITRGAGATLISGHAIGTIVSQYQCTLEARGLSPQTNAFAQRNLQEDFQLQTMYVVGNNNTYLQWNGPANELQWQISSGSANNRTYSAVDILNAHQGWAVGARRNNNLSINRLSQGAWSSFQVAAGSGRANLYGVSAVSSLEAWTVGQRRNNQFTLWRWLGGNGSNWCRVLTSSSCGGKQITASVANNQKDLYAIKTLDTTGNGLANVGFAVGGRNQNGRILQYNGTVWSLSVIAAPQIGRLYGVFITPLGTASTLEAWAVGRASNGNRGKILRFNGTQWVLSFNANSNSDRDIRAISMIDTTGNGRADYGWAVGRNGRAYLYNGSSWSGPSILTNQHLYGVTVLSPNDAWAVGNRGTRLHWDGSTWNSFQTNVSTTRQLNGIASVSTQNQPASTWRELNN